MRSTIATLILGLSLVAGCEVGDAGGGGGGGGGDDTGGGGADAAVGETPKLAISVDKTTVNTELMTTTQITATLTSTGGFTGAVTLTPSVVDSGGAPITGWTAGLNMTSVNVPADGTATAVLTLTIPSDSAALAGTVKLDAVSSLGTQTAMSTVTAANRVTVSVKNNGAQCVYPAGMTVTRIKLGSTLRFVNTATTPGDVVRIHMDENAANTSGLQHEQADILGPTQFYDQVPSGADADGVGWYCHTPGNNPGNLKIVVVP